MIKELTGKRIAFFGSEHEVIEVIEKISARPPNSGAV
jgi:hypothetical protein